MCLDDKHIFSIIDSILIIRLLPNRARSAAAVMLLVVVVGFHQMAPVPFSQFNIFGREQKQKQKWWWWSTKNAKLSQMNENDEKDVHLDE